MNLVTNTNDIIKVNFDNTLIQKVIMDHTQIFESRKKSALEWLNAGYTTDGVYTIYPDGVNAVLAYCDMTTDGISNLSDYESKSVYWKYLDTRDNSIVDTEINNSLEIL